MQFKMVRQINLQQTAPHGSYGTGFLLVGTPAQNLFSSRLAPDQSLLILNPDTSGEWPLVRVRNWWTEAPLIEVLKIPGWTKADAKNMAETYSDLQVSPDGHYAVAFAGASWMKKGDAPFFVSLPKVARKPDTIITVIDLERWRIAGSIHTANLEDTDFRGARILNGKWIVLQGGVESSSRHSVYLRSNRLISIPDLKPGPECTSQRPGLDERKPESAAAQSMRQINDAACRDVLRETGAGSVEELESLIYMGHHTEPRSLRLRSLDFAPLPGLRTDGDRLAAAEEREMLEYFDHWTLSRDQIVSGNPPLESSSLTWYGMYDSHERPYYYELDKFDAEGQKLKGRTARNLLCGDPNLQGRRSACGCRVDDVSEEQHALLIYCRTQRGNFDGPFQAQWLSVFRSDDLSAVGFVRLSKDKETTETLAVGDGRTYILVVELGQTIRIYAVPSFP
jgi:hypothetical protein